MAVRSPSRIYVSPRDTEDEANNIKVKDNKLTFEISGEADGNEYVAVYTGKPKGDSIKGTIDYEFGGNPGTLDYRGKRLREGEDTE